MRLKDGHAEKKMYSNVISRSFGFIQCFVSPLAILGPKIVRI